MKIYKFSSGYLIQYAPGDVLVVADSLKQAQSMAIRALVNYPHHLVADIPARTSDEFHIDVIHKYAREIHNDVYHNNDVQIADSFCILGSD